MTLSEKIIASIKLIQDTENLALKYQDTGFHVAFSGGKDSMIIYELCKMAGVKYTTHMQLTTVDPPEVLRFVKKYYPDCILHRPKRSMFQLIIDEKSLPTQLIRFCCKKIKETAGINTVTILGLRKAESRRRANRIELEQTCIKGQDKIILCPILEWSEKDVWDFIKERNLPYCKLYNEGHKRIGCILCPMSSSKAKRLDLINYPKFVYAYKKAITKLVNQTGIYSSLNCDTDLIFNWWISGDSVKVFLEKRKQTSLEL